MSSITHNFIFACFTALKSKTCPYLPLKQNDNPEVLVVQWVFGRKPSMHCDLVIRTGSYL